MDDLSRLYLVTTDPQTSYKRLAKLDVLLSTVGHAIVYALVLNTVIPSTGYVWWLRLMIPVVFGAYFLRLSRVKSIPSSDPRVIRETTDKLFHVWYFLG